MQWENLKDGACPKCGRGLTREKINGSHICDKCGFRISEVKYNSVASSLYNKKRRYNPEYEDRSDWE